MRRLAGVPYARSYLAGQMVSIAGDTCLWLALAVWVRELTGSSAAAGLLFFFLAVPSILGPVVGAVADRFRRRPVLVIANGGGVLASLLLLGVRGPHEVWLIYLAMFGFGAVGSLQSAAQSGLLHTLLPEDLLPDAAGVLVTARESLRLGAPLLGVGLFTVAGGHVVAVVDAVTFLVPVVLLCRMRVDEPAVHRVRQPLRAELAEGLGHIRRVGALRQMVVSLVVCCCVIGFLEPASIAVVTDGLHLSASWIGPLQLPMGIGAVVGGSTVARTVRRLGEGVTAALGMIATGVGFGVEVWTTAPVVVGGLVLCGFGLPWLVAPVGAAAQRLTPARLQGRVSGTIDVLTSTPQSVSIAVGATLLAIVGFRPLLVVVLVVMVGAGCWLASRPEQRLVPAGAAETAEAVVSGA